jgi:peptide chain release factor subunit 1
MGAVETLILWEKLEIIRATVVDKNSGNVEIKYHTKSSNRDFDSENDMPLLDWLSNNYRKYGCVLEFITDKSQEGSQFVRGFGGIGGILRYQIEPLDSHCEPNEMNEIKQEKEFAWDTESDFI